ncbi:response regulator transcription factor [Coralliovum pocilloporae]|uniref:response regulator transcription factor n=1 Tax=Coralliovum pocilloporae TaxID=3066369 RepID=UPI0033078DD2
MRILLVEDNSKLAAGICDVLQGGGFQVDVVENGLDADAAIATTTFDLIVLDLTLPDLDGLEVLTNLRNRGVAVPVLIVTARGDLDDRIRGLDLGADDYLTKPFDVAELEARVRALIRRSSGRAQSTIRVAQLTLDLSSNALSSETGLIEIPPRELAVLRLMLLSKSDVVPKSKLMESLSTFDSDPSENAIEQIISRLRKRLAPHGISIKTARGIGYFILVDEEQEA